MVPFPIHPNDHSKNSISYLTYPLLSQSAGTVPQSMIGGSESLSQGPWPECLNMAAVDCIKYIETYADDLRSSHNIIVVEPDMMVTMDYRTDRVRVYVDESNIVIQTPRRG
jgi:Potato inhibitor I family